MSDTLKLKLKIGEIEFEADGPVEAVEQQREIFVNGVLPAAVNAMAQTRSAVDSKDSKVYIESTPQGPMLEAGDQQSTIQTAENDGYDFLRIGLASFLKKYGTLTEQDFTLFAAYFDEKKNNNRCVSIDDVKRYYSEARRSVPTNPSMSLNRLAEKGFIMDTEAPEGAKTGKYYMLTQDGIAYVEGYTPKEDIGEKKKTRAKAKKASSSYDGAYVSINADDLNLKAYPSVKSLSGVKEQIVMSMYIVSNEGKGEWFTVEDLLHLLIHVFEVPADNDKINGVFKRNKSWFASEQDESNKKAYRRKLLGAAKDYAKDIIGASPTHGSEKQVD